MDFEEILNYDVTIKIRNDFIIVTSKELGLTFSAGSLSKFSLEEIGSAVMKCYHAIYQELSKGNTGQKPPERFLTIGEAAEILHTSHSTLRRLIAKEKIQSVWTEGGHRRISARSIEALIRMEKKGPSDEGPPK